MNVLENVCFSVKRKRSSMIVFPSVALQNCLFFRHLLFLSFYSIVRVTVCLSLFSLSLFLILSLPLHLLSLCLFSLFLSVGYKIIHGQYIDENLCMIIAIICLNNDLYVRSINIYNLYILLLSIILSLSLSLSLFLSLSLPPSLSLSHTHSRFLSYYYRLFSLTFCCSLILILFNSNKIIYLVWRHMNM